ncbi:MAG TPA: alpha/beta hydrolase fold domain-containing protein [Cytophaga sp.]|nr:alpha/beta hydrolase fold domain-containing protein [Cytophaga sp.]
MNKSKESITPTPASATSNSIQLRTASSWRNNLTFQTRTGRTNLFDIRNFTDCPPTPLIISFFPGGFTAGDKADMRPGASNIMVGYLTEDQLESQQIAYATPNYNKLYASPSGSNIGVANPLNECLDFVNYMCANAAQYNIDPNKIILMGSSAGASTSLWIGLQNNLTTHPIKGIVAICPQASLNILEWRDQVYAPFGQTGTYDAYITSPANSILIDPNYISLLYGTYFSPYYAPVNAAYIIQGNKIKTYCNNNHLSYMNLMDSNDPELYLTSFGDITDLLHQSCHVYALQQRAQQKGLRSAIYFTSSPSYSAPQPSVISFCVRKFNE